MFSEYWLTRHNRLIGLTPQKPFEIPYAREHSVFWRATEERLANIAAFFRRLKPFHLADAPGGAGLYHGRFRRRNDARKASFRRELRGLSFEQTAAAEYRSAFRAREKPGSAQRSMAARFSREQFSFQRQALSTDQDPRRTPLARLATNAKAGHVWDNFSSQTYKELSPVDELEFFNPFDETRPIKFKPKDKNVGPGYYRTPSLVSLWSSAPVSAQQHAREIYRRSFRGRPDRRLQRRSGEAALAGETPRTRLLSGARRTSARCICARNSCRNRCKRLADKRWLYQASDPSRKARRST